MYALQFSDEDALQSMYRWIAGKLRNALYGGVDSMQTCLG